MSALAPHSFPGDKGKGSWSPAGPYPCAFPPLRLARAPWEAGPRTQGSPALARPQASALAWPGLAAPALAALFLPGSHHPRGQGCSRGQLFCLIPGNHQSLPFTLLPVSTTFFSSWIMRPPETGGGLNLVMALSIGRHQ